MAAERDIGYRDGVSTRSALAGAAAATAVFAALGNQAVVDAVPDSDFRALGLTLTGFADWDTAGESAEVVGGTALRIGATVVIAGLLCALVGRTHRGAAFLGGWGAAVVAAGAAGAMFHVYDIALINDGETPGGTYLDALTEQVNRGAAFGLWTGWLVGAAVAVAARTAHVPAAAGHPVGPTAVPTAVASGSATGAGPWAAGATAGAPGAAQNPAPAAAAGPPLSDPPAPWWAPTWGPDGTAGVRPGPTAFPPGGFATSAPRPVAPEGPPPPVIPPSAPGSGPGAGVSHELSTTSGDPHPSDPAATQAVTNPLGDAATPREAPGETGGAAADATAMSQPPGRDYTVPMRREAD
jgi:hypothetical protein